MGQHRKQGSRSKLEHHAKKRHKHGPHSVSAATEGGNDIITNAAGLYDSWSYQTEVQFGAEQIPARAFQEDNLFSDIRITGAGIDVLEYMVLWVEATNNDPLNSITVLPTDMWFTRKEWMTDGASVDDTTYDLHGYLDSMQGLDFDKKQCIGNSSYGIPAGPAYGADIVHQSTFVSTNPTYGSQSAIVTDDTGSAAEYNLSLKYNLTGATAYDECTNNIVPVGGVAERFYDISRNIWCQAKLFLPNLSVTPRLRLFFRNGIEVQSTNNPLQSESFQAGNKLATCSRLQLIVHGCVYHPRVRSGLMKMYKSTPAVSRVVTHERQISDFTANAGTESGNFSLTALNGRMNCMSIICRLDAAVAEQLYDSGLDWLNGDRHSFVMLEDLTLTSSTGETEAFPRIPARFKRALSTYYANLGNALPHDKMIYVWSFANDIMAGRWGNASTGSKDFDGNWTLRVTPAIQDPAFGAILPAACQLLIYCDRQAELTQYPNGKVSVVKQ